MTDGLLQTCRLTFTSPVPARNRLEILLLQESRENPSVILFGGGWLRPGFCRVLSKPPRCSFWKEPAAGTGPGISPGCCSAAVSVDGLVFTQHASPGVTGSVSASRDRTVCARRRASQGRARGCVPLAPRRLAGVCRASGPSPRSSLLEKVAIWWVFSVNNY